MVETLAKSSSENANAKEIISQVLASGLPSRNHKACGNKGASTTQHTERDFSEDLSDISDTEVVGYLNNEKEFLLKKILWETMNQDYQKGSQGKGATRKKKTIPTKKAMANASESSANTENKKRLSSKINYEALEKLFESEESPKRAKKEKSEAAGRLKEDLERAGELSIRESQKYENYCAGDMHGDGEYYNGVVFEDQNEGDEYDYYSNFDDE